MNRISHIASRVAGGVLDAEATAKQRDLQDFRQSIHFLEIEGKRLDQGNSLENILGGEKFSWKTRQQILNIIDLMEIHEGDSDFVVPKNLHHFFEGYRLKFLARSKIPGDLPTEPFPTNFTPEYVINKVAAVISNSLLSEISTKGVLPHNLDDLLFWHKDEIRSAGFLTLKLNRGNRFHDPQVKVVFVKGMNGDYYFDENGIEKASIDAAKMETMLHSLSRRASKSIEFPHRTQSFAYDCGATAVLTVLQYYGFNEDMINEQGVFDAIGTDINGTDNEGIEAGMTKLGFKYERVMTLEDIDRHVEAGRPVLVSVAQWIENGVPVWHYEVVTARDGDHYIIADPWAVNLVWVPREVFEKIWYEPHDVEVRRWGIGVYGEAKYHEVIAPMDYKLARISARVAAKALKPDKILNFPFCHQVYDYDCGACALQSILTYYGGTVREQKIMDKADTSEEDGTDAPGILKALRFYGLKYEDGSMTVEQIKKYLDKNVPVMMIIQAYNGKPPKTWKGKPDHSHWVVAIGYKGDKIIFEDPDAPFRTYVDKKDLMDRWYDYNNDPHYYGIAVFGKPVFKPDLILPLKRSETEAEGRMEKLKKS